MTEDKVATKNNVRANVNLDKLTSAGGGLPDDTSVNSRAGRKALERRNEHYRYSGGEKMPEEEKNININEEETELEVIYSEPVSDLGKSSYRTEEKSGQSQSGYSSFIDELAAALNLRAFLIGRGISLDKRLSEILSRLEFDYREDLNAFFQRLN